MRILASISLILLGLGIVLSVITYNEADLSLGEWFLPAPRSVNNLMGPFGAWIALRLVICCGYFSIIIGLILIALGVGRFLRWKFTLIAKIILLTLGWTIAIALPISAIGGDWANSLLGKSSELLESILAHTGSVGKIFVSFGIFILWFFWATGIGYKRPAIFIYNIFAGIVGLPKKIAEKRRQRDASERRKLLEEHRKRQEAIQRRISSARTGKLVPGELPEEILIPPKAAKLAEEYAEDSAGKVEISKDMKVDENLDDISPGMTDEKYVPPPIVVSSQQQKSEKLSEPTISGDEKHTSRKESSTISPSETSAPTEEVIVPTSSDIKRTEEVRNIPEPSEKEQPNEVPEWLVTELPPKQDTKEETESSPKNTDVIEEEKSITSEEEGFEEPEVVEPQESPGEEIEPLDAGEDSEISPDKVATSETENNEGEIVLNEVKYTPPPIGILHPPENRALKYSEFELQQMAKKLFDALKTYNVDGKVTAITPGPVITRFEFEPAPGIKISRIVNLADDLALSLKARDVRIVAPIPGKGTVGIEIPNKEQEIVYIRSVLESQAFQNTKAALPMALGKKVAGEPIVADLAKMPHLLIAGATGSGKSVCINSIITSLIYKKTPNELRLLLIDPKRLELSIYNGIPFLIAPVVVEHKEASAALNWGLIEMERRYRKLAEARVRNLEAYNRAVESKPELGQKLPYIVIIIDELADLMMTVANEIEEPIARLAQMARAVGIHLILATQRPSVDVVTGIIKANFPSRIAFKVRSKIDSRTILDMGGAERLLGHGDMLYLPSGFADPIRIHGSFVDTAESENLVEYLKQFENPQSEKLSFKEVLAKKMMQVERDELFWEAAKIVIMSQKGSASHLQRKLRVGYTRAASLIDQLEATGIVGPFEGSKPREVLIKTFEELDELKKQLGD